MAEAGRVPSINNQNGVESCVAEVVGSEAPDLSAEGERLHGLLEKEVKDFRKTDRFTIIFVNKSLRTVLSWEGGKRVKD